MSTTYAKTRKGQEEIETRSGALLPRARRLLILIDGKRDVGALKAMIGETSMEDTLQSLWQDGYIEPMAVELPEPEREAEPAASETGRKPAGAPTGDPKQLEMARNFMLNTIKTFNGPYNKLGLMTKIRDGKAAADLRGLFDEWLHAISETRMGKLRAEELGGQLRVVLRKAG